MSNIREYEFTFILRADIPEVERLKVQEKYESFISKHSGEILKKEDWGVQKLSYPIKKQFKGHYIFYDFIVDSQSLSEYERLLRIDDKVMRYLLVKINDNVNVEHRKVELSKTDVEKKLNFFDDSSLNIVANIHDHEEPGDVDHAVDYEEEFDSHEKNYEKEE